MSTIDVTRLNPALEGRYVIERELGEGGMATVFLAEDLKHHRSVALKVLKPELAAVVGAERFLTEIETTANLQHPHILPLFDSGEADSFLFYVMPYVEGETLGERLARERQLPVDDAVRLATDMAEALDYAHRHGVVHRDIKPGNVLLHEGRPLIADFGIALAVGAAGGTRLTETGLSVGTPYYMSPEQATGDQTLGAASDIYSLACVLYEMLVGEPPYGGATAQAVLGKIISGGPVSPADERRSIPANVDAAIRKALEKLPADRFSAAKDFANALGDASFRHGVSTAAAGVASPWNKVSIGATAAAVVFAALFGWSATQPEAQPELTRLSVALPQGGAGFFDLSADGRTAVYRGATPDGTAAGIWVRRLDQLESTFVRGSSFAGPPSIDPGGSLVAFNSEGPGGIRVESLAGGGGHSVAEDVDSLVSSVLRFDPTGEWIYFQTARAPGRALRLMRVPAAGGPVEEVAVLHDGFVLENHHFDVLPSGDAALVEHKDTGTPAIHLLDFTTGESTFLVAGEYPRYASGHIVFTAPDGPTLMAAPFDPERRELTGSAVTVAERLLAGGGGFRQFTVSESGVLLYSAGSLVAPEYHLTAVSRQGVTTTLDPDWTFDPGGNNRALALSPEGDRMALVIFDNGNYDIWVKQLPGGPLTRVTFSDGWDVRPRWAPDGRLTYLSMHEGAADDMRVSSMNPSGTGTPVELMNSELPFFEALYSPDMKWLLGRTGGQTTAPGGRDVWVMEVGVDTAPRNLLATDFDEKAIDLSPDGRWLLYESDETGRNEIYVRPFPNVDDDKITVSEDGGVMPKWSGRGGEIFYINEDREVVAASVEAAARFRVTDRTRLFELPAGTMFRTGEQYALYDVSPDDQTFYFFVSTIREQAQPELIYVQNWQEGLPGR